ncbi:MAG: hypothetical protein QG641_2310 [Candidatus Poribacteria bacterium]|nr:hypothetical protein [Candidatus Poribacteria bacterium]
MSLLAKSCMFILLCVLSIMLLSCQINKQRVNSLADTSKPQIADKKTNELPDINTFAHTKSDRFMVNIEDIETGHPFLGIRSKKPHSGAHVHFKNVSPKGGNKPENYPPIYAVADGIITRVDYCFPLSNSTGMSHERYGLDLSFARDGKDGSIYNLAYSIEPMVMQPSVDFYRQFILVSEGQHVKKGDIIAYMYVPPDANGTHIHFDINNFQKSKNYFMAPALFTPEVVQKFYETWRGESSMDGNTPIPPCMGYMLGDYENPFDGAVDKL